MAGAAVATTAAGSRSVVVASADAALRQRLRTSLSGMRWQVREAAGGAEAMAYLDEQTAEVLLLDHWLPDLEVGEFAQQVQQMYPEVELMGMDGELLPGERPGPRRIELLRVLREAVDVVVSSETPLEETQPTAKAEPTAHEEEHLGIRAVDKPSARRAAVAAIDGLVGESAALREVARLVHLVAPRTTTVLIEGETGTGKEIVAKALHRLSPRSSKAFAVLNCAAIPEALLEAELFGHTRGAFTGAVQSRTGRIEAAHGGTLFLDEIGEMPLPLQAKMLRFLESGELQRVGDNETLHVDVRVVAATHQHLERRVEEGSFRLDLYHRLAVFAIEVPPLRQRREDIAVLAEHLLGLLGRGAARKRLSAESLERLRGYDWPGNVRELAHQLERASILAEDAEVIGVEHLRLPGRGGR